VIVTRPAGEADAWVAALDAQGWTACSLPLIDIGPPSDPQVLDRLHQVQRQWSSWDALMFVSAAAVEHFFQGAVTDPGALDRPLPRWWAPGPGTARALAVGLQRLGVSVDRIDQPPADARQFDSEHLWPVVSPQVGPGMRLLLVRGASLSAAGVVLGGPAGSGREWMIERCRARGAQVDACAAYERHPPSWSAEQRALAQQATAAGHLWLFSSSEALAHLCKALPGADWSAAGALCTHDRIADAARQAGFGEVFSSRPSLPEVLVTLESTRSSL
jgi:uroporphyrinogen-III synthase